MYIPLCQHTNFIFLLLPAQNFVVACMFTMSEPFVDSIFLLQIGLAGNLKDYVLISHNGEAKKGSEICTYGGSPVGYTSSPIETVNFLNFLFFSQTRRRAGYLVLR